MDEYLTKEVHDEFARRIEAEEARQNHRLTELESTIKQLNELTVAVKELATSMSSMQATLEKPGQRLEVIEKEPADNWKKAVWIIVAALVGFAARSLFGI